MKIEYDQSNKMWMIIDADGNRWGFSSITEARDWMDHMENMINYKGKK